MIQIDTEVLKQLSAAAKSATGELENAAQILNQITVHNDWGCKERYSINEAILKIKKNMATVRESSGGFTNIITLVADEFTTEEKKIAEMFEGLETLLGKFISIVAPVSITTPPIIDSITELFENGESDWTNSIDITNFQEVLESITSGGSSGNGSGGGGGGAWGAGNGGGGIR